MKSTRLAVCGAGLVGQRHVKAIQQLPNAKLVGIVDVSEQGRRFAADNQVPCFQTIDQLFENTTPDGIVISTPTSLHVEQGLKCIERGCPALVEKPLCVHANEGRTLVERSEASGTPMLVGHHRRYNPLIEKAHQVIADGLVGEVRAVNATCWFYKPDEYFKVAPWRTQLGAGPISVNLVHDVDLIRYLVGEVVSVQAQSTPSRRGFENEDVAAAVLKFSNGAIGTITVADSIVAPWSWELTSREYPIYPATPENCYLIGGSHGSLSVPDLRLWSHKDGRQDWWSEISSTSQHRNSSDPLLNQMRHFVDVIANNAVPLVSVREGLKTLEVVEAIQESAKSNQMVVLENSKIQSSAA